jgi:hypothetical protein
MDMADAMIIETALSLLCARIILSNGASTGTGHEVLAKADCLVARLQQSKKLAKKEFVQRN